MSIILPVKFSYLDTDIDETLVPGEQLMDKQAKEKSMDSLKMSKKEKEICFKSTVEYFRQLDDMRKQLNLEIEKLAKSGEIFGGQWKDVNKALRDLYNYKLPEHYRCKDIVREELMPVFEGLINYFEIYIPENLYPGIAEVLWYAYREKLYQKFAAPSITNSLRENAAKDSLLLCGALPPIEGFYDLYHKKPYFNPDGTINKKRIGSDKVSDFIATHPDIDINRSTWIDNTRSVRDRAKELGFDAYLVGDEWSPATSYAPCKAFVDAFNQKIASEFADTKSPIDVKEFVKK